MRSRSSGTGNRLRMIPMVAASAAATAAARTLAPSGMPSTTTASGKSRSAGLHDGLEHRLRVRRRAADDLQDLRGRGLLLERLLGLVEQAHVLDRDHRLVGEGLAAARPACSGNVPCVVPRDDDDAERHVVAQHRHTEHAAPAGNAIGARAWLVVRIRRGCPRSVSICRLAITRPDSTDVSPALTGYVSRSFVSCSGETPCERRDLQHVAIDAQRRRIRRRRRGAGAFARSRRTPAARSSERADDRRQDLGRRRLPLERLLGLVEQAHVLDRDHRLVGEGLEQIDLRVG